MRDAANSFVATLLHNSFVATLLHGRHGKEVGKKDLKGRWSWEVGKLGWGGGGAVDSGLRRRADVARQSA